MDLAEIVPFGRALAEYRAFFALSDQDLQARIVDCAAGPASFVAEAPRPALALDPIYALPIAGIRSRFAAVVDDIIDQVIATPERWVWHFHRNPADLRAHREAACERFCSHREAHPERYLTAALPTLPLPDNSADLCLVSHFLFLYGDRLDADFHCAAISECLRIAPELRVFPLIDLQHNRSPHLHAVADLCQQAGWHMQIQTVDYELQRGGNAMLVITRT